MIIEAGDAFHMYHGILLGQRKTFSTKKTYSKIFAKKKKKKKSYPTLTNSMIIFEITLKTMTTNANAYKLAKVHNKEGFVILIIRTTFKHLYLSKY